MREREKRIWHVSEVDSSATLDCFKYVYEIGKTMLGAKVWFHRKENQRNLVLWEGFVRNKGVQ